MTTPGTPSVANSGTAELLDADDPFTLFRQWMSEAEVGELNDPNAMALATVGPDGCPDVRMVLLKGFDHAGFVFYTNTESRKAQQLIANPTAALCFHWKSLRRQVRTQGLVTLVSAAEADAYFATRARESQIGAWASRQSRPLGSRAELIQATEDYALRFASGPVPRPPFWSGFRLRPLRIEFWRDRPFRLHDRLLFTRAGLEEGWTRQLLFP